MSVNKEYYENIIQRTDSSLLRGKKVLKKVENTLENVNY